MTNKDIHARLHDQVFEAAAQPETADWSEEAWNEPLAHVLDCNPCRELFEQFVVIPLDRQILEHVARELPPQPSSRFVPASGPANLPPGRRNKGSPVGRSLSPLVGSAALDRAALLSATRTKQHELVRSISRCNRVEFTLQLDRDCRQVTVNLKGDEDLLRQLNFTLEMGERSGPDQKGTSGNLAPEMFGAKLAYLKIDLAALGIHGNRFFDVRLSDSEHGVVLDFGSFAPEDATL